MKMRQRRVLANRCVPTEFGPRPFLLTPYINAGCCGVSRATLTC